MVPQFVIQVPRSSWPDVQKLLDTPLDLLQKLADCVTTIQPQSDIEDLATYCASSTNIPEKHVEGILAVAVNLSAVHRRLALSSEETVAAFARALEQSDFPDWEGSKASAWSERVGIAQQLFISGSAIETMSKARELLFEFQCVLQDSAVLTDVRYIYDNEATDVKGALVLHTLTLDYVEGREPRQIHVTLTYEDASNLCAQLERAQRKAKVTGNLLEKWQVPELTPKRNRQL